MAKKIGFEVVSTNSVCVDFRDGRAISFQPGQRFVAVLTNSSVLRLLRNKELRKLGKFEVVPPLPVKLGAPLRVQNIMKRRADVARAQEAARAKLAASKAAAPKAEPVVDLGSPIKKKTPKKKSKPSATGPRSGDGK